MYAKINKSPFIKGEKLKVYRTVNGIAITEKGKISLHDLEKHRSEFRLKVQTPNGTKIRILNIKPKYRDNIWLKRGKYHIEVSAKKHIMHKEWINLQKDTQLLIVLKRKKNISLGFIYWQEFKDVKYLNGIFWQDQAINKQKTMNWYQAKKYCSDLSIKINPNFTVNDFELPNEKELLSLRKQSSIFDYIGSIYWSLSNDEKKSQFAEYVYMNNQKKGWYNKSGQMYVKCVSRKMYPTDLSLKDLTKYLMKKEHNSYLHALEKALNVKYGKPIIKYAKKDKKNKIEFTLRSQKYDSNKHYFYYKVHKTNSIKNIKTDPKIKFEIINDKLIYRGIY